MCKISECYEIPTIIVELLRKWYTGISSCGRVEGGEEDWFPIRNGLRQGCVLSPLLFSVYMDAMMRKVTKKSPRGVGVGRKTVVDLDITDYVALLADTWMVLVGRVMRVEVVTQCDNDKVIIRTTF